MVSRGREGEKGQGRRGRGGRWFKDERANTDHHSVHCPRKGLVPCRNLTWPPSDEGRRSKRLCEEFAKVASIEPTFDFLVCGPARLTSSLKEDDGSSWKIWRNIRQFMMIKETRSLRIIEQVTIQLSKMKKVMEMWLHYLSFISNNQLKCEANNANKLLAQVHEVLGVAPQENAEDQKTDFDDWRISGDKRNITNG